MNWDPSVIKFTDAEYGEWLEQFGHWTVNADHVVHITTFKALNDAEHVLHTMICKTLTDDTNNFLFHYKICSNE